MSEYKEKPKRRPFQERPYLYLALGILIGIVVAGIAFVALFVIADTQTTVSELIVESTVVAAPYPTATPIAPPVNIQPTVPPMPTVVADRIQSAKISPDGKQIAVISVDNGISRVLLNTLQNGGTSSNFVIFAEQGYYNDAIFSPDGHYLMVTTEQFTGPSSAILFDTTNRTILEKFLEIHAAAFSPDSSRLVLVSANSGIRMVDTATRNLISSLQFDANIVQAVDYSKKNQIAIAADSQVLIYDAQNLPAPPKIIAANSLVYDIAFTPNGENLAIASDNQVQIVNIQTGVRSYFNFDARQVLAVAFSKDGKWLAAGGGESGIGQASLMAVRWQQDNVLHPDPNYYAPIYFSGHRHVITDVMFTSDGNLLSASWDGTVRLWDLETRREIEQMSF